MLPPPEPLRRLTYAEYLAHEHADGRKHAYDGGTATALDAASPRHNALASRISAALEAARGPGCIAFQSDQRVRILATGKAVYPDASLVCGPLELDPADPTGTTIANPLLIVEVRSPSTEQEDRGNKWQHYQLIPSLQEYVLISQSSARVEWYRRLPSGGWEYHHATEGTVRLPSGVTLDLARLYDDLPA